MTFCVTASNVFVKWIPPQIFRKSLSKFVEHLVFKERLSVAAFKSGCFLLIIRKYQVRLLLSFFGRAAQRKQTKFILRRNGNWFSGAKLVS